MSDIGLIVADPGHFHAALVQREMHPNLSPRVHVYAPVGPDLIDYLTRISRFNTRPQRPTRWEIEVHACPDFLERLCRERSGNVVVFSGRNRGKIQGILAAIEAGIDVLADKPLIIRREDLSALETAMNAAQDRGLILYDMSSARSQVVGDLTRLLHGDPEVFGEPAAGTLNEPGVTVASVHHIMKQVAGVPNLRPPWFFDISQQGESLADVGTHLVDRIHSTLFPADSIDYRTEIRLHAATRWPTRISAAQFLQVTGEPAWPEYLKPWISGGSLDYFCNTRVQYQIRGVHASVETRWNWEAEAGDDTQTACYRGSRAHLELRQGAEERYRSELYVVPFADIAAALERRISALQTAYPGISLAKLGREWRVKIPDALRIGHEAHFAQLTRNFLDRVEHRRPLPAREKPNTLAKYFVCTEGVGIVRRKSSVKGPARSPDGITIPVPAVCEPKLVRTIAMLIEQLQPRGLLRYRNASLPHLLLAAPDGVIERDDRGLSGPTGGGSGSRRSRDGWSRRPLPAPTPSDRAAGSARCGATQHRYSRWSAASSTGCFSPMYLVLTTPPSTIG